MFKLTQRRQTVFYEIRSQSVYIPSQSVKTGQSNEIRTVKKDEKKVINKMSHYMKLVYKKQLFFLLENFDSH